MLGESGKLLFERSAFLIATCKKKKLTVCPDVRVILVLVWKNCLGFSVGYVLCASPYCYIQEKKTDGLCGCVCVDVRICFGFSVNCLGFSVGYVQPVQYKHHVVRSIARSGVSPPGARSDGHHWCQAARTAATCT